MTKEKIKLLLEVLINSKDKEGYLPNRSIEAYCDMLNVTKNIVQALRQCGVFSGVAKQKKKILIKSIDDELIEMIYKTHRYKSARVIDEKVGEKDLQQMIIEQSEMISTMAAQVSYIYNELVFTKK